MKLEDYFVVDDTGSIRLKGSRIGVESVLYVYIHREQTPEAIAGRFPSLNLEQVYATILYYLHNRDRMNRYLEEWLEWGQEARQEQQRNPPPVVARLQALKGDPTPPPNSDAKHPISAR